ncbi:MAG: outer membrane beta-barrel protein [Desulfobacterales bacterium]|nr:outer membrane beta-barrel protein [Desulfobacterales bacterium]
MKKLLLILFVFILTSTMVFSQEMDMVQGGTGFLGLSLPLGDFGDSFNSGFQFGISVRSTIPGMENVDGDFTIGFAKYGGETGGIIKESEYTIIPLTVNGILNLNPTERLNPYLLAGIGYYLLRDVYTVEWTETDNWGDTWTYTLDYDERDGPVGINLGGGVMYFINKNMCVEGCAKYHYILREGDSISLLDIRLGAGFYF